MLQRYSILAAGAALAVGLSGCDSSTKAGSGADTGAATSTTVAASGSAAATAVATYREYVEDEVGKLVKATTSFVAAVKSGDVSAAKALYPTARTHYETIEPVGEIFEALDAKIDARANDVPASLFRGFHRIEQQLWEAGNTTGMDHVADDLLADVKRLQSFVPTVELEPAQIATGAVELLNDVANSKISGEEERYSHTDLWDFDANDDGAMAAFDAVRPLIAAENAELVATIDRQFASTDAELDRYKTAGGGFRLVTELTTAQTRALAAQVEALADSLAKVPALVVVAA